jgi:hypothetical protein
LIRRGDDRQVDLRPPVDLVAGRGILLQDRAGLLGVVGGLDGRDRADLESGILELADRLGPPVADHVGDGDQHPRLLIVVVQDVDGQEPQQGPQERDQHERDDDRHPVRAAIGFGWGKHLGRVRWWAVQDLGRSGGE